MKKIASIILAISLLLICVPTAYAEESALTAMEVKNVIIEDATIGIDPSSDEESFSKILYISEDEVLEDGTIVMKCSDVAPRYTTNLEMIMIIEKVAPYRYSVEVQAYAGISMFLIKSFSAVLDYGNGEQVQGWGVNEPPLIDGCTTTISRITYPDCVYTPGTYRLRITSFHLVICEYINTDNTEDAGLILHDEILIVGEEG